MAAQRSSMVQAVPRLCFSLHICICMYTELTVISYRCLNPYVRKCIFRCNDDWIWPLVSGRGSSGQRICPYVHSLLYWVYWMTYDQLLHMYIILRRVGNLTENFLNFCGHQETFTRKFINAWVHIVPHGYKKNLFFFHRLRINSLPPWKVSNKK